jgi:non-specific serine/threonine protein kinase/serine/threonine-protein kinase
MTPERWQQIKQMLGVALSLPADARASYLSTASAGDPDLGREVESLLSAHVMAGEAFLETPAANLTIPPAESARPITRAGRRIGPYDVLEQIGHGGMGEVYRAVRADGHFTKEVALKLVRTGFDTAFVVDRFRHERQILASLDHPNIARLLDGGTTDDGVPYLVMELVEGVPIDSYCDAHQLTVPARLRLFQQVCAAVHYAHQHLVVHRDLKPTNILVTADGTPKLLDFGIAKILDSSAPADVTFARPMTIEYASPEQIHGEPITTATDVYSLGVILYRLLTGRSPYRLENSTAGELAAAITNREPQRPSTAVVRAEETAHLPAASARLERQLRGDLDVILLKALRKEPARRYSSAEQLAGDIARHLDGLPVTARKGTWSYSAGKFIGRHRAAVAAAVLVLLTLIAGIVVTAREARIAETNRRRADARFNDVRKLANSLLFEVHDSIKSLPGATDARKLILQRSLEYLDSLASESSNEPDLVRELATAYSRVGELQGNPFALNLGDTRAAGESLQKAMRMRESLAHANPGNSSDQIALGIAYRDYSEFQAEGAGNLTVGFDYAKRALAILEREAGRKPGDAGLVMQTLETMTSVGMMQIGEGLLGRVGTVSQGLADLQKALGLARRAVEASPSDVNLLAQDAAIEITMGDALLKLADRPESLTHYQQAITLMDPMVRRRDNVRAAFNTAVTYGRLGDVHLIDGDASGALPYYTEAERRSSKLAGDDPHNETMRKQEAIALVELGHVLVELGKTGDGLSYMRRALASVEADPTTTPVIRSTESLIRGWLGEGLERQGNIRDASEQYAIAKDRMSRAISASPAIDTRMQGYFGAATDRLAATFVKLGEPDKASGEYEQVRKALEPLVTADPEDHELAYVLAETYTGEGNIEMARARRAVDRQEKLENWQGASEWFRKSMNVWSQVPHPARTSTSGFEVTVPVIVSARLAECNQEIRSLAGAVVTPH